MKLKTILFLTILLLPGTSLLHAEPSSSQTHIYLPGTEKLASNEMRITAVGTGSPQARRSQVGSCWLVELGNGDRFLFDLGLGSYINLAAMDIPFNALNKVFITHLHTDHWGDFAGLLVSGWVNSRTVPLEVWGPSGDKPEFGTRYAVERVVDSLKWDLTSRAGDLSPNGNKVVINEFDYAKAQVVYEKNGVTISAFPAIHVLDGAVSYSLQWNGMKFAYSGDTFPNQWFVEYAKGADIAVHEAFFTVRQLYVDQHFPAQTAWSVGTQFHTAPEACGKVFSLTKPRMAVAYHTFNEFDTHDETIAALRETYDGPLTLAEDFMIFNVTKDTMTIRKMAVPIETWAAPSGEHFTPNTAARPKLSEQIQKGALNIDDVLKKILDGMGEEYKSKMKADK